MVEENKRDNAKEKVDEALLATYAKGSAIERVGEHIIVRAPYKCGCDVLSDRLYSLQAVRELREGR